MYADRMSVNLELPTEAGLRELAPNKTRKNILTPMRQIQAGKVETSAKKAGNVLETIESRISHEAYFFVMSALLSEDEDRGNVIYQFVTYGFTIGAGITKALQLECVARIFEIKKDFNRGLGKKA